MTLELSQVALQVKAMGQSLAEQNPARSQTRQQAQALLQQFSTAFDTLTDRIRQAERVQHTLRFDWVGAAPTGEPLAQAHPLPDCPEKITVIASDGSQILPDQHALFPYYLINTGSITYRHGSNTKPDTFNPPPILCYEPYDEQGRLISTAEINVERDLAELKILVEQIERHPAGREPVVALLDGQLALRVIDLPFDRQETCLAGYLAMLDTLHQRQAITASYVDRPRSTFVLALLYLASLKPEAITETALRQNPFRFLTDLDLFDFLGPGERSALFAVKGKGFDKYQARGHAIHFFYVNVGATAPVLARVEIPEWVAKNVQALNALHAVVVRQARITGGYPYVLARADELAVISTKEREAVEMMLAVELRRRGIVPQISEKRRSKNSFRFSRRKF